MSCSLLKPRFFSRINCNCLPDVIAAMIRITEMENWPITSAFLKPPCPLDVNLLLSMLTGLKEDKMNAGYNPDKKLTSKTKAGKPIYNEGLVKKLNANCFSRNSFK